MAWRWVFWLALVGLAMPLRGNAVTYYRLNAAASAVDPALAGLQIVAHTVAQTDQDLILRLGVFNNTDKPIVLDDKLKSEDLMLVSFAHGARVQTTPSTCTLTELCPGGTLPPKEVNNGLATFIWGSKEVEAARLGTLTLRVGRFAPLSFSLDPERRFLPIDFKAMEKRSPLNLDVTAQLEGLAIFTMRLNSLVVQDNELEVVLSFKNSSRFPITWKGGVNGTMCRLITSHGDRVPPSHVSDSFKDRIAPPGKDWQAGEDNFGSIRFPLPAPETAEEMIFSFVGYPPVRLTLNREEHVWQPAARAKAADAPVTKADAVAEEERVFAQLKAFWSAASAELAQARFTEFLRHFTGEAHRDQRTSIASWSRLPVTSVEFDVTEYQHVKPDTKGLVKGVRVQMRHTIATMPRENLFVTNLECDMRRDEEGRWTVEDVRYPSTQPFWLLGYTSVSQSAHFTIFHRGGAEMLKEVETVSGQLEKGYMRLLKTGLPLKARHAAFIVASKDDFEKLTDRSAENFSGVASSAYQYKDGQISVINEAMYINDEKFTSLQRAWGKQDRQVVIQHEMVHLALADLTRPWTPAWLAEGMAMHYANQTDSFTRASLRQTLKPLVTLPSLSRLTRLGADTDDAVRLMTEYQLSSEAVLWLMKKYGETAVMRFYKAFANGLPDEVATLRDKGEEGKAARQRNTARMLDRLFPGLTLEDLDSAVRRVVKG